MLQQEGTVSLLAVTLCKRRLKRKINSITGMVKYFTFLFVLNNKKTKKELYIDMKFFCYKAVTLFLFNA